MNRLMRIVGIRVEINKLMSIIGIQFLRIRYSVWVAPKRGQKRILPFSFEFFENVSTKSALIIGNHSKK